MLDQIFFNPVFWFEQASRRIRFRFLGIIFVTVQEILLHCLYRAIERIAQLILPP